MRLWWICLLVVAMPFKAWALASGAHCGAVQPTAGGQSVNMASHAAAMMHGTHVDADASTEACPGHAAEAGSSVTALTDNGAAELTTDTAHHSCSACSHCGSASTLPSVWISPTVEAPPHALPATRLGTWRSATVRHLDRPPTHGVI